AMCLCRNDAASLRHLFKELVQLGSWNSSAARIIGADSEWQKLLHALAEQRRDRNHRRPTEKLHLLAHLALELRARLRVLILQSVPFVQCQDYRATCFGCVTGD